MNRAYDKILAERTPTQAAAVAEERINAVAENVRARIANPHPNQAASYVNKAMEAEALLSGGGEEDALALSEEAAELGVPITDLAAEVAAQAHAWRRFTGRVDGLRRAANTDCRALAATGTVEDIAARAQTAIDALNATAAG